MATGGWRTSLTLDCHYEWVDTRDTQSFPLEEFVDQVHAVLGREVARVDDPAASRPGEDPSDAIGWHPSGDAVDEEDHRHVSARPAYDPESWRYFDLLDVAYLDGLAVIEFHWTAPGTPTLRYLVLCAVSIAIRNGVTEHTPRIAAYLVRTHLRYLLSPGWREQVSRIWLGRDRVLIQPAGPQYERTQAVLDQLWTRAPQDESSPG